jgi:hypothetical protein
MPSGCYGNQVITTWFPLKFRSIVTAVPKKFIYSSKPFAKVFANQGQSISKVNAFKFKY